MQEKLVPGCHTLLEFLSQVGQVLSRSPGSRRHFSSLRRLMIDHTTDKTKGEPVSWPLGLS